MARTWILQTNAARLDVDAYLRSREAVVWGCGRYRREIARGDRTFLWRAAGGTKLLAGIVATATVVEEAEERVHDGPEFCRDPKLLRPKPRLVVRIDDLRPDDPLPRPVVKAHPLLSTHPIVTANQGCAFVLTEAQAAALDDLWRD